MKTWGVLFFPSQIVFFEIIPEHYTDFLLPQVLGLNWAVWHVLQRRNAKSAPDERLAGDTARLWNCTLWNSRAVV